MSSTYNFDDLDLHLLNFQNQIYCIFSLSRKRNNNEGINTNTKNKISMAFD